MEANDGPGVFRERALEPIREQTGRHFTVVAVFDSLTEDIETIIQGNTVPAEATPMRFMPRGGA